VAAILAGLTGAGLSEDEAHALVNGTLASLTTSSERLCEVGLKFVQVLEALPDDARRRVLATVSASEARN
jgi:hypothetical protein